MNPNDVFNIAKALTREEFLILKKLIESEITITIKKK